MVRLLSRCDTNPHSLSFHAPCLPYPYFPILQGCNRTSLECVPLYDTLGDTAIEFVMKHSETKFVCSAGDKLQGLAKGITKFSKQLVGVVYWGEAPKEAIEVKISISGFSVAGLRVQGSVLSLSLSLCLSMSRW